MQIYLDESILLTSIGLTLVHFLWQGLAVALVLKIILWVVPKAQSQLRYLAATGAMALCLVLPIATFFYIYQPQHIAQQVAHLAPIATLLDLQSSYQGKDQWQRNFAETLPHLTIIWLCVVGLLAIKMLIEMRSVTKLPYQQSIGATEELEQRFAQLCQRMGFKKHPVLRISLKTQVPMAIGFIKPVVVLPATMLTGLTSEQLEMLILHELAHIRRHDYLVNILQSLAEIALFFHPVVYWISKQMRIEREYCSDDIAVHHCGNAIAYAHTLADTATICQEHRNQSIPMMAMAASGGDLKERIVRLVQPHHCTQNNETSKWLASIVVVISIALLSFSQVIQVNKMVLKSSPSVILNSVAKPQSLTVFEASTKLFNADHLPELSIAKQLLSGNEKNPVIEQPSTAQDIQKAKPIDIKPVAQATKPTSDDVAQLTPSKPERATSSNRAVADTVASNTQTEDSEVQLPSLEKRIEPAIQYARQLQSLAQEPVIQTNFNQLSNSPAAAVEVVSAPVQPVFEPATLLESQAPRYPISAKRKKLEIEMMVNFTIDAQGYVKDIQFEYQPKVSYFRTAVRNALSEWRFTPAMQDGKAVESKMSKIFSFSLGK